MIAAGALRRLILHRFGLVFVALLAAIVVGLVLLTVAPYSWSNAVYLTLMDLTGSALTNTKASGAEKVSQVLLTFDGLAFIPVITAIIVGARLTGSVRRPPRPAGGHVIVVGLGNVGTSVTGQPHDLGFDVACIDNNPNALGVSMAGQLGIPMVTGDAFREETLRRRTRLVTAPRLPARPRRPADHPGHQGRPGPVPLRALAGPGRNSRSLFRTANGVCVLPPGQDPTAIANTCMSKSVGSVTEATVLPASNGSEDGG